MKITAENKTDYLETHFEVVQTILWISNNERLILEGDELCKAMRSLYQQHGRGVLWVLAENITDAFMKENEHRVWDGEWGEEVVDFTEKWLFKTLLQQELN